MAAPMEKLMTKAIDQYLKLYQNPDDFFRYPVLSSIVYLCTFLFTATSEIINGFESYYSDDG